MAQSIQTIFNNLGEAKRRIAELYQAILDEKVVTTELNELNATSKTAAYRLIMFIVACAYWLTESLLDALRDEIDQRIASKLVGTEGWLEAEAVKFQFGDSLVFNTADGQYSYPAVDLTKRIVKFSAVSSSSGVTILKVAKEVGGAPAKLSTPEKAAFDSYVNKIQFAGTAVVARSENADLLKLIATVYYDPIETVGSVTAAVEAAVNNYLTGLNFKGQLVINDLVEVVRAVPNVNDFTIATIEAKEDGGIYNDVDRLYNSFAGYLKIDPAFPMSSNLTYTIDA
jgi:hypothetical protein